MVYSGLSERQQAFVEYAIARAKFEILDDMELGHVIPKTIARFDDLAQYVAPDEMYGGRCDKEMVELGEFLFSIVCDSKPSEEYRPPIPGPEYKEACAMIQGAIDEWLRKR